MLKYSRGMVYFLGGAMLWFYVIGSNAEDRQAYSVAMGLGATANLALIWITIKQFLYMRGKQHDRDTNDD